MQSNIDLEQQLEEKLAIESIYQKELIIYITNTKLNIQLNYFLNINPNLFNLLLIINLPNNYPSKQIPSISWIDEKLILELKDQQEIEKKLKEIFIQGEVVLFDWLNLLENWFNENKLRLKDKIRLKEIEEKEKEKEKETFLNSNKEKINNENEDDNNNLVKINIPNEVIIGETIIDRKSIFLSFCYKVEIKDYLNKSIHKIHEELLLNKKISKATHNVWAYRIIDNKNNNTVISDCDDDGETAAGSRLLHLLNVLKVENIFVMVSRWYGGIPLGPDRFKHFNNAARQVLDKAKLLNK